MLGGVTGGYGVVEYGHEHIEQYHVTTAHEQKEEYPTQNRLNRHHLPEGEVA